MTTNGRCSRGPLLLLGWRTIQEGGDMTDAKTYEAYAIKDGDLILLDTVRGTAWSCHCLQDDRGQMVSLKTGHKIVKVQVMEVVE